ncbi:MAG: hypothetical protein AAGJ93_00490 [Bacteroidota bacterium]
MNTRHLILFVFLLISTSMVAQKRAQKPRPVKAPSQRVENTNNNVQPGAIALKTDQQGITFMSGSEKETSIEQGPTSSMADRFNYPESAAPAFSYEDHLHTMETPYDREKMIKLGVGDVRIDHPQEQEEEDN